MIIRSKGVSSARMLMKTLTLCEHISKSKMYIEGNMNLPVFLVFANGKFGMSKYITSKQIKISRN